MIKLTNILPLRNSKVNRLHFLTALLFLSLFAFPLFPLKVTNVLLILFSVFTVVAFIIKPIPIGKIILPNLVFVLPFIPFLIEFCFSKFDPTARFEFEKKLFFFTAPFTIPLFMQLIGFRNFKLAFLVFAISVSCLTLYSITVLLYHGIPIYSSAYENGAYIFRLNFEQISGLHPTYYSAFALFSAGFLWQGSSKVKGLVRLIYFVFTAILLLMVLLLAVRIAFLTLVIILIFWVINSKLSIWRKLLLGFVTLLLLAGVAITIPSLKNRLGEITSWETGQTNNNNTVSQRTTILDCSLTVFSDNLLWGTGSRNFQHQLNNCYCSENWLAGSEQSFNPHNQYLSMGITYGLIVLLLFLSCLFIIFRKIFRIHEGKYFAFIIILFFMSESMLERQMGVYYFGLISLILYNIAPADATNNISKKKKKETN